MDAKNKSNIKLLSIVASVMLLIIVVGASFAYFGTYKEDIDKYKINITIDQFAKATFVTKDANLNLVVSKKNMVAYETATKAAENSANLNVVLTSGNPNVKVTCTYDIYYEYDTNSSIYGVSPTPVTDSSLKELTLKAVGSTGTNNYIDEKNFNYDTSWTTNPYKRLIVKGASITDATKNGTTDTWNFNMAFYNLEADQNKLAGKTFAGTFYVDKDSIQCDYQNNDGGSSVSGTSFEALMTPNNTDIFNEQGIRYEGADPNNYICLDNKTSGSCSSSSLLFRIIGLFEEDTSSDGITSAGTKKLLKVIDTSNYGTSGEAWDDGSLKNVKKSIGSREQYKITLLAPEVGGTGTNGTNNWSTASLKTELYGTYLTTLLRTSSVNSKLSSAITNAKWHLGGASDSNYQTLTTEGIYIEERNTNAIYSGNPSSIYAQVGLMYPSDYGYATVGGTTTNKSGCRAKELYNWNGSSFSDCKNNDWLFTSQDNFEYGAEWLLSPYSSDSKRATILYSLGDVNFTGSSIDIRFDVRPVFYLDSSILKIVGTGDGTKDNAYRVG